MENYPCVNATNVRLGSLIKQIDAIHNTSYLCIITQVKFIEVTNYTSFKIKYLNNEDDESSLSFINTKGFYPYMFVLSY